MTQPACLIAIPARRAATRLPDKPLEDLGGRPMIVRVWERAVAAQLGPVVVATGDEPVAAAIESAGGTAVRTTGAHGSGSDRIAEAVRRYDPQRHFDVVVNVQGDLPLLAPATIQATVAPLAEDGAISLATPVAPLGADEADDPNVVKAACELGADGRRGRALYFSRAAIPWGEAVPRWHHIGLYAFRRSVLERLVAAPPSLLERHEKLEQLRALAGGERIEAVRVEQVPLGVDSPADLERARAELGSI